MIEYDDMQMMSRAAWLYYVGGLNQEETAKRLKTTRARINKLLQLARDSGIVSISIDDRDTGLLETEEKLCKYFGLEQCICTTPLGLSQGIEVPGQLKDYPRRAVGLLAARLLRDILSKKPEAIIGTGWGRTLDHIARNMAGFTCPQARFVSLMGSLTANSAFNPFEVVQALANATGAEGYFMPVPFIVDSPEDRNLLFAQTTMQSVLNMARKPDFAIISVGELTKTCLLRQSNMISDTDLHELHQAGAIGDTNGIFFNREGSPVDHSLNKRTLAVGFDVLRNSHTILLSGGIEKTEATIALLKSKIVKTLIIDGDTALKINKTIKMLS